MQQRYVAVVQEVVWVDWYARASHTKSREERHDAKWFGGTGLDDFHRVDIVGETSIRNLVHKSNVDHLLQIQLHRKIISVL